MPSDEFIAEIARLKAAAETLWAIEQECVAGIPEELTFLAVSQIISAYDAGRALPSPILGVTLEES